MDVLRVSEPFAEVTAADPSPELVDAYEWEPSLADLEYMREQDAEYEEREHAEPWDEP